MNLFIVGIVLSVIGAISIITMIYVNSPKLKLILGAGGIMLPLGSFIALTFDDKGHTLDAIINQDFLCLIFLCMISLLLMCITALYVYHLKKVYTNMKTEKKNEEE